MATIVTPAILRALFTSYRAEYQAGLSMVTPTYARLSTEIPSGSASNTYGWLGQFPQFSKWAGSRQIKAMAAHGYALTNELFETTVGVQRTDIEDDSVGVYKPLFQEMGRAAAIYPDEHVYALLMAGDKTKCYDGQNFFDKDHPVYPNVDGTGTVKTVSNLLAPAKPQDAKPAWYLLDTSRAIKPLIFQRRIAPQLQAMTNVDDEKVFMEDTFRYGVRARSAVGFGFWQMAMKITVDLDHDSFNEALAIMRSFKADGGRPLAIQPNLLVCGPQLRNKALMVAKATTIMGTTNINANIVDVLDTPYLA